MTRPLYIDDYGWQAPFETVTRSEPTSLLHPMGGRRWRISEDGETAQLIQIIKFYGLMENRQSVPEEVEDGPVVPVVWDGNDPWLAEEGVDEMIEQLLERKRIEEEEEG